MEGCIQSLEISHEEKNTLRSRNINVLTNFGYKYQQRRKKHSPVHDCYNETRVFLKDHPELLIMRSDKGSSTVIMSKSEYHDNMNGVLADINTYKKTNSDPTSRRGRPLLIQTKTKLVHPIEYLPFVYI